ncbi:primosomal protein [Phenylobacterium sp. LH3H17]|uniref:primosomal protein n=1 Tax=Phenylobacterium sp. LH3H17 TaxID=2903901 RepID=UPI0020C9BB57|nr:primosomal protein [Phenylobacterium sp. LH3H17]UTP37994.1 primosomal protein [Phenylobacterium sp. LH3H17]
MPGPEIGDGYDEQDGAETYDESNLDDHEGLNEMRTFEELPDLLDVTSARGDRDEDEALALDADEFDEDAFTDADLEDDDELHYRATAGDEDEERDAFDEDRVDPDSIDGLEEVADAELVSGGEDDFTNFQSKGLSDEDLDRMGYARRPASAQDSTRKN